MFSSPILKINLNPNYKGKIWLKNFSISNISKVADQNKQQELCEVANSSTPISFDCKDTVLDNSQETLIIYTTQKQLEKQKNCNNQILSSNEKSNFSLIQIKDIQKQHTIQIEQMQFQSIICNSYQYGIINLLGLQKQSKTNINLNEISFSDCNCGLSSCLAIINDLSSINFQSQLISGSSMLQQLNYPYISATLGLQIVLSNSNFLSNKAKFGGGICVIGMDILVQNSCFMKKTTSIGGAIYYQKNNSQLLLLQTQILLNTAKMAGAIFQYDSYLQETKSLDPRSLAISTDNEKTLLSKNIFYSSSKQIIERTLIQPYKILGYKEKVDTLTLPSGFEIGSYSYFDLYTSSIIPYNITFRMLALNKLQDVKTSLQGTYCTLQYKIINTTKQEEIFDNHSESLSFSKVIFNAEKKDFNLDNLIIYFNPYDQKEIVLKIFIKCDFIQIPIYDKKPPFLITSYINNYQLFVDIRTFPCQIGEYFNSTSEICIQCSPQQSQFQVQQNAQSCQFKDDQKIKSIKSNAIELKENFWRPYLHSTKIEECFHLIQNCLGGWKPGDDSCEQGHAGALCEQCDLYNIRGQGYFATSKPYTCGDCSQISRNMISITII